jgi:hypothetical protein
MIKFLLVLSNCTGKSIMTGTISVATQVSNLTVQVVMGYNYVPEKTNANNTFADTNGTNVEND